MKKVPICIGMRPMLIDQVDELARQAGLSRSELIGRLLGTFVSDLLQPEIAWVKIKRDELFRILKV